MQCNVLYYHKENAYKEEEDKTHINIIEEDITSIMLDISILPENTDDSFLETNCTLSVCVNTSSDNVLAFTSSTVIEKSLNIPVYKGDQLILDWH